jgi:hypothetical protein
MTLSRLHITALLGLGTVVWGATLLFQDVPLSLRHLGPFGLVVSVLTLALLLLEHLLWRCPWLQPWFIARPLLRGTWRVRLQSDWVDPNTNQPVPPIDCFMGVEQTLSRLQLHLMSSESESWLLAHDIRIAPSGTGYQVVGVYTNTPRIDLRNDRSRIHLGTLLLHTHGPSNARPTSISGEYWTDRKTSGRMDFSDRIQSVHSRYEDARRGFAQASSPGAGG